MDAGQFTRGDLVTVTYDDGTQTRAWHGRFDGIIRALVTDLGPTAAPNRYLQTFIDAAKDSLGAPKWVRLTAADAYHWDLQGLYYSGPHWWLGDLSMAIDIEMPGVTVTALTDEGRTWLLANESAARTRDRFIARFAEFDPEAAAALNDTIETLTENAYERGQDSERSTCC